MNQYDVKLVSKGMKRANWVGKVVALVSVFILSLGASTVYANDLTSPPASKWRAASASASFEVSFTVVGWLSTTVAPHQTVSYPYGSSSPKMTPVVLSNGNQLMQVEF